MPTGTVIYHALGFILIGGCLVEVHSASTMYLCTHISYKVGTESWELENKEEIVLECIRSPEGVEDGESSLALGIVISLRPVKLFCRERENKRWESRE